MSRSEEDVVLMVPITITLGGVDYDIEPLKIRKARDWRKALSNIKDALSDMPSEVENVGELLACVPALVEGLFVTIPDKIISLVFLYAPNLPVDTIEENATDAEMITAFVEILKVAFPFGKALGSLVGPGGLLDKMTESTTVPSTKSPSPSGE